MQKTLELLQTLYGGRIDIRVTWRKFPQFRWTLRIGPKYICIDFDHSFLMSRNGHDIMKSFVTESTALDTVVRAINWESEHDRTRTT